MSGIALEGFLDRSRRVFSGTGTSIDSGVSDILENSSMLSKLHSCGHVGLLDVGEKFAVLR
jgi:hypothetical protein